MKKRQTWTNEENEQLTRIVGEFTASLPNGPLRWERIASELAKAGTTKSSKQCREQWAH